MNAIFITTDPTQDLNDCGAINTAASRAAFARAYELAGARLARAMRRDVHILVSDEMDRRDAFGRRNPAALRQLAGEIWQELHEAVKPGARNGTWKVGRTAAQWTAIGRRYRAAFDRALAAPEQDEA